MKGVGSSVGSHRLIVQKIPKKWTHDTMWEIFSKVGTPENIHLNPPYEEDLYTWGFVDYSTLKEAENAIKYISNNVAADRIIISFQEDNACSYKSKTKNDSRTTTEAESHRLYISNIPLSWTQESMREIFCKVGTPTNVYLDPSTGKKHFTWGIVEYSQIQEAQNAIKFISGNVAADRIVVSFAKPKRVPYNLKQKNSPHTNAKTTAEAYRLYVSNIPVSWKHGLMKQIFSKVGNPTKVYLNPSIGNRRFTWGIVEYLNIHEALDAIEHISGNVAADCVNVSFAREKRQNSSTSVMVDCWDDDFENEFFLDDTNTECLAEGFIVETSENGTFQSDASFINKALVDIYNRIHEAHGDDINDYDIIIEGVIFEQVVHPGFPEDKENLTNVSEKALSLLPVPDSSDQISVCDSQTSKCDKDAIKPSNIQRLDSSFLNKDEDNLTNVSKKALSVPDDSIDQINVCDPHTSKCDKDAIKSSNIQPLDSFQNKVDISENDRSSGFHVGLNEEMNKEALPIIPEPNNSLDQVKVCDSQTSLPEDVIKPSNIRNFDSALKYLDGIPEKRRSICKPHMFNLPAQGPPFDEYAGLMTPQEKQWLTNIQMMDLNPNQPFLDDYYYNVGSVTAPRKIIDMVVPCNNTETTVKHVDGKSKEILFEIEQLFDIVLKMEETSHNNITNSELPGEEEPNLQALQDKILKTLFKRDKLVSIMSIRKGKKLVLRLLPILDHPAPLVHQLLVDLVPIAKKDVEQFLLSFLPPIRTYFSSVDLASIVQIVKPYDSEFLLSTKFTTSVIATMIDRAAQVLHQCDDTDIIQEWKQTLIRLILSTEQSTSNERAVIAVDKDVLQEQLNLVKGLFEQELADKLIQVISYHPHPHPPDTTSNGHN